MNRSGSAARTRNSPTCTMAPIDLAEARFFSLHFYTGSLANASHCARARSNEGPISHNCAVATRPHPGTPFDSNVPWSRFVNGRLACPDHSVGPLRDDPSCRGCQPSTCADVLTAEDGGIVGGVLSQKISDQRSRCVLAECLKIMLTTPTNGVTIHISRFQPIRGRPRWNVTPTSSQLSRSCAPTPASRTATVSR